MPPWSINDPVTISEARRALDRGLSSSVELVERAVAGISAHDSDLGIFLTTTIDTARKAAAAADARRDSAGPLGPLDGIPIVVKDIVFTADAPTTGQSLIRDSSATDDAPVAAQLRNAGAVFLGKTSTMEFALGFTDPEKPFPLPRNPWDRAHWAGGSSSGTATAVATGIALGGIGTDTAGSIREPAAWCGITGLKPTHGLVSQAGVLPLGWSFDHVGPMARTAEDCALLLDAMAIPAAGRRPYADHAELPGLDGLDGLRVGVALDPLEQSEDAVRDRVAAATAVLAQAGAVVREVRLPHYAEATDLVMLGLVAEALAYHRNDAVDRWIEYGRSTRAALLTALLLTGADVVQLQRVRRHLQQQAAALYRDVDVILAPVAGGPAPAADPLDFDEVVGLIQTHYWNATGEPALSVPIGTVRGLPVGMQIVGPTHHDARVLDVGRAFQQLTDHHLAGPFADAVLDQEVCR